MLLYIVIYFEEPIYIEELTPALDEKKNQKNIYILTPLIPKSFSRTAINILQKSLLDTFIRNNSLEVSIFWYLSPMFINWIQYLHLRHAHSDVITIYDCMD